MDWSKLSHLQLGKYGEYFAKMEAVKCGLDVYTAEVDDKGIDFVARNQNGKYFEIQVKSARNNNYVFMRKEVFSPRENLYLALLIFGKEVPAIILIPSMDWANKKYEFLKDEDYEGKISNPEYGIRFSKESLAIMESEYSFSKMTSTFLSGADKKVGDMTSKDLKQT
jgi:hypothetical protein